MAKGKRSQKGKGTYVAYKSENRVLKNKIAKLERHIKQQPNDEKAVKELARIKKAGYTGRTAPARTSSRLAHLRGGEKGSLIPKSLNRLGGKISSWGKLFQQLKKEAKV